jgi:hypothetical protein
MRELGFGLTSLALESCKLKVEVDGCFYSLLQAPLCSLLQTPIFSLLQAPLCSLLQAPPSSSLFLQAFLCSLLQAQENTNRNNEEMRGGKYLLFPPHFPLTDP